MSASPAERALLLACSATLRELLAHAVNRFPFEADFRLSLEDIRSKHRAALEQLDEAAAEAGDVKQDGAEAPGNLRRCENCRYWQQFHAPGGGVIGECKRHAPLAVPPHSPHGQPAGVSPIVEPSNWCGDWERQP